jgi:IclR family pca regulon transcriptional regulator
MSRQLTADATEEGGRTEFVQSLERGLSVIRAFSAEHRSLTLSEAARLAGLTRATARRVLLTLEALGYVRSNGRVYELTPLVLELGYAYVSSLGLPELAQGVMEALSDEVGESVSMAVLDGRQIVYVARVPTKRIMRISLGIGSRLPAATTSMGRVLLAELAPAELDAWLAGHVIERLTERTITDHDALRSALHDVRAQGWALVDQELEDGVRSIAAPLRDRHGRALAAMNVSCQSVRTGLKEMRTDLLPRLLAAAAEIDAQLARR